MDRSVREIQPAAGVRFLQPFPHRRNADGYHALHSVNYLNASAPELKGLWAIAPIPGVLNEDGTVNNTETANGTASIILGNTKQPENAYKFLKWWVSAEAQGRFGVELEQNMGSSARYPTANVEAFDQLPWTKSQADSLSAQWEAVTDVPQIPRQLLHHPQRFLRVQSGGL